ncbi:fumarylacetoacetate hydrolase family protein [Achromobacter sp. GG226]|uniref:fumarylacetoacetate hydrolase family protein n=1 Tax=Verticiella alkaliphila TaxID=2779529 RepID=UPI001C0D4F0B|nr:fumarylacetoacetate hydrolase family protein [Verticiella sp. GG226]MBU4612284.1 fumarylacetoacetate hydrolase family protein [Verticiella sp. GG226]
MKLVSFETGGQARFGVVAGEGVVDLTTRLGADITTLRAALAADLLPRIAQIAEQTAPDHRLDAVRLVSPIPDAEKIICVGVNYGNRNEEYKDGSAPPAYPSVFPRFTRSFVGHGDALRRPPESAQLDYEGEIAIVIGKPGRRIPEAEAESHIAGLTCLNEGTIRDWLRHGKFNVTQGKNWDASGSIGPWLVTADAFAGYDDLTVTTRVNGEVRQHDTTANLMFSFRRLIHYISTWTTLVPGDIISTGTPVGAGVRFDPPRFLQPGDRVEVDVPGIGVLVNEVRDEEVSPC